MYAYKSDLREIAERVNRIIKCLNVECDPVWVDEGDFSCMVKRMIVSINTRVHNFETMIPYFRFEFASFCISSLLHGVDLNMKFDKHIKKHGGNCALVEFKQEKIYEKFVNLLGK
jgi:hypothetical protein